MIPLFIYDDNRNVVKIIKITNNFDDAFEIVSWSDNFFFHGERTVLEFKERLMEKIKSHLKKAEKANTEADKILESIRNIPDNFKIID